LSFPFAAPALASGPVPPPARPRENGGSPLSAGVSPPQKGKARASYRFAPSPEVKASPVRPDPKAILPVPKEEQSSIFRCENGADFYAFGGNSLSLSLHKTFGT